MATSNTIVSLYWRVPVHEWTKIDNILYNDKDNEEDKDQVSQSRKREGDNDTKREWIRVGKKDGKRERERRKEF